MVKPEKKLIDLGRMLRTVRSKGRKFIDQKILSASKALLLVGGDSNPLFRDRLVQKCKSSWRIAGISANSFECDLHIPLTSFSKDRLDEIEKKVFGFHKLYESIVMLP
jgi:hypothetical protein